MIRLPLRSPARTDRGTNAVEQTSEHRHALRPAIGVDEIDRRRRGRDLRQRARLFVDGQHVERIARRASAAALADDIDEAVGRVDGELKDRRGPETCAKESGLGSSASGRQLIASVNFVETIGWPVRSFFQVVSVT